MAILAFLEDSQHRLDGGKRVASGLQARDGDSLPLVSIVEDDHLVLKSFARLLRSAGFRVAPFNSAEEFLQARDTAEFHCVVLDLRLPGMSGLDLQARLNADGCNLPLVFVTAQDDPESRNQALQSGAVAFLGKPIRDEVLLDAIRPVLRR